MLRLSGYNEAPSSVEDENQMVEVFRGCLRREIKSQKLKVKVGSANVV